MNLKIQISGFFEIFGYHCPDIQGLAVVVLHFFSSHVIVAVDYFVKMTKQLGFALLLRYYLGSYTLQKSVTHT